MSKVFIVVQSRRSIYNICTDDLSKVYYFQKRTSPVLPSYFENEDRDDMGINDWVMDKSLETGGHSVCSNLTM